MISTTDASAGLSAYECEIGVQEEKPTGPVRCIRALAAGVAFLLLSWGVGTLVLIGQGECATCLDTGHILVAIYGGVVILLIVGGFLTCCAVCFIGVAGLATARSDSS